MEETPMKTLLLLILAALPLAAATITTPGLWEASALYQNSRVTIQVSWDGNRYSMQETGGVGEAYRFGLLGFSGATSDAHRLTLLFNAPGEYSVFLRRLESFIPPGLGYLPYGHLYGGEWPEDIPRFLGCDDPWFIAQQEHWKALNCDGNCSKISNSSPDTTTPTGEEVPEPATLALVAAALLAFSRRLR
jgi:hypothetical protein